MFAPNAGGFRTPLARKRPGFFMYEGDAFPIKEKQRDEMLTSPDSALLDLLNCSNCDVFVVIYDRRKRISFATASIQSLVGCPFAEWPYPTWDAWLTNHDDNLPAKSGREFSMCPGQCDRIECEVNCLQSTKKVTFRRHPIVLDNEVIGMASLGWATDPIPQLLGECLADYTLGISESTMLSRWATLTRAEIDVLEGVVAGDLNKTIAKHLELAERTVEARRSKLMKKLGINNLPALVRFHLIVKHTLEARKARHDSFKTNEEVYQVTQSAQDESASDDNEAEFS